MAILCIQKGDQELRWEFDPPQSLQKLLSDADVLQPHPCGGRGTCGKCAVSLYGDVSAPNERETAAGVRLSCQAVVLGDARVELSGREAQSRIQTNSNTVLLSGTPMAGSIGAAVDIGTTTLALRRYDLHTGMLVGESATVNPQTAIAADVIGRIEAAMNGRLEAMQQQVSAAILELLQQAGGSADTMVITGNTTMFYLLTGRDPVCLSKVPFLADTLFDVSVPMFDANVYLPPCLNAFVGADITCAVLASRMCGSGTTLLCDIGTNGEIALWNQGVLYVTATAAGPAFEGAGISCGCNSIPGAIDAVWVENGKLRVHTIDNLPAVGICGSGLIDAAAQLLDLEIVDETGTLENREFYLAPDVYLLQKDIRGIQLAKAAIAAGIETLLEYAKLSYDDIETFYIAGGFGSHLDVSNAVRIGLIPEKFMNKVQVIGNAALAGASQILLNRDCAVEVRRIAGAAKHINLGGNPRFNAHYMDAMMFPYDE